MSTVTIIAPTITAEEKSREIRCAAYCRVSSDSTDQLNSFAAQIRYYENLFEGKKDERLVQIYADEGVTGTCEDKRDELLRLMNDCRKGKIDRIYTKSVSRFARNTVDCLKNVRELKGLGISVFFEKECIDTAEISDEIFITIMGGLAQEESTSISRNLRWSVKKRMESGTMKMTNDLFGYSLVCGELIVNNDEAEIVQQIYELYLSGYGVNAIAKMLNKCSVCKEGKPYHWSASGVRFLLRNEKYIGDQLFQKNYTTDTIPFQTRKNRGEKTQYYYTERHEPIISREVYQAANELLDKRSGCFSSSNREYVFSKKIFCKVCGMTYKIKKHSKKTYWVCRNHDDSADNCPSKQVLETDIKNAFVRLYNKLLFSYKNILVPLRNSLWELKQRDIKVNRNMIKIHREIAKLKEQTHLIARLRTKGFLDEEKYLTQSNEIGMKINKLRTELNKLAQDDDDDTLEQLDMLIDIFENRTEPMTAFEEREFDSIIEKITAMGDGRLQFHLIGGLKLTEKI